MQMATRRCQATQQLMVIERSGRCMMIRFENAVRATVGVVALLMIAPPSEAALEKKQATPQMSKRAMTRNCTSLYCR